MHACSILQCCSTTFPLSLVFLDILKSSPPPCMILHAITLAVKNNTQSPFSRVIIHVWRYGLTLLYEGEQGVRLSPATQNPT